MHVVGSCLDFRAEQLQYSVLCLLKSDDVKLCHNVVNGMLSMLVEQVMT